MTRRSALNGTDSAENQVQLQRFLTTSSVLPKSDYPQFSSDPAIVKAGPPAYDPPEGSRYMYSQVADQSYKRLSTTVDLTGHSAGSLSFKLSYDTEPRLRLRVRRGAHRGPGRLDDAAGAGHHDAGRRRRLR